MSYYLHPIIFFANDKTKYILPLSAYATESKIKRRSRLKLTRNSNVSMLRVVLKTAHRFGRSLANSSKTSDEVKIQTFLQVKSILNINDVRLAQSVNYHQQKDPKITQFLHNRVLYIILCHCFISTLVSVP